MNIMFSRPAHSNCTRTGVVPCPCFHMMLQHRHSASAPRPAAPAVRCLVFSAVVPELDRVLGPWLVGSCPVTSCIKWHTRQMSYLQKRGEGGEYQYLGCRGHATAGGLGGVRRAVI